MLAVCVALTSLESVSLADDDIVTSGEVAVATTYLWRGINYHDDRFEPAIQPYVEVSWRGLAAGVWASVPTSEQTETADEYDPYVTYTRAVGPIEVELLYWVFVLPDFDPIDSGHLLQATGTYGAASAGASVDPIRDGGAYYFATGTHEVAVGDELSITGSVNAAVSHGGGQDFGVQDVTATAVGTYAPEGARWYASATGTLAYGPRMPDGERIIPVLAVAVGASL